MYNNYKRTPNPRHPHTVNMYTKLSKRKVFHALTMHNTHTPIPSKPYLKPEPPTSYIQYLQADLYPTTPKFLCALKWNTSTKQNAAQRPNYIPHKVAKEVCHTHSNYAQQPEALH